MLKYSSSNKLGLQLRRFAQRGFSQKQNTENFKYAGNGVVGIVREQFSMWERRSPLCPHHVTDLTKQGIKVLIQPCERRAYSRKEFSEAGAIFTEDLSEANLILGVKKIPNEIIKPGKNYMFFTHVIKAQQENMQMLDHILDCKARVFDYECITKNGEDTTPRLVAFGKFAGLAGMIDGLQGFGQRLLAEGYSTPFLNIPTAHMFQNIDQARYVIRNVGHQIENQSLPKDLCPLVFAFTGGDGNVCKGAREIFELLPHEYVTVEELPTLREDILSGKKRENKLYGVLLTSTDMVRLKSPEGVKSTGPVDKKHYYSNPSEYESTFQEKVLPYTSFLANCMYWDARFPRLITKKQIADHHKQHAQSGTPMSLRFLADITCDPSGSVEFMSKATTTERPFFSYDPVTDTITDDITSTGISVVSVEILPTELPRDSSGHFGAALMPLLPALLKTTGSNHPTDFTDLPPELTRACIASHGELLPRWTYISRLRDQLAAARGSDYTVPVAGEATMSITMTGHLFDTGVINQVLDVMELQRDIKFSITNCDVRPNITAVQPQTSRIRVELRGSVESLTSMGQSIKSVVEGVEGAEGLVDVVLKGEAEVSATDSASLGKAKTSSFPSPHRVLLLGAGRVAQPVVQLLCGEKYSGKSAVFDKDNGIHVTIASDCEAQARALIKSSGVEDDSSVSVVPLALPHDQSKLDTLVKSCDVVLSLLPATMHLSVAELALKYKKHLVTASYVPESVKALHEQAEKEGLVFLQEVGLDPGIDHMLIMKSVHDIQNRGGKVEELVSLCGGVPDPVAACEPDNNPLRYKFSWSPRGVLTAAQNSAQYLENGKLIQVPSHDLLKSARASERFPTMRLEALPNRDSLMYRALYGIPEVNSICRGTLRYEGWGNAMHALKALGVLDMQPISIDNLSWPALLRKCMDKTVNNGSTTTTDAELTEVLNMHGVRDIPAAIEAIKWLGLHSEDTALAATNAPGSVDVVPMDALCQLLEGRLNYAPGESDMVAMYHSVTGRMPNGAIERHTSRLLAFGDPEPSPTDTNVIDNNTAMAATVGFTAGAAVELVLFDKLKHRGVMIPTTPDVYEPLMARLEECGITWTESISVEDPKA